MEKILINPSADHQSLINANAAATVGASHLAIKNSAPDHDAGDDCVMIGEMVPRPFISTSDGLMKRERDAITDKIPFISTVSNEIFFK